MEEEIEKRIEELQDALDSSYSGGEWREEKERKLKILKDFYEAMFED